MTDEPLIMVVDDDAPMRSAIASRLDLEGYAVVEARNADEAIETLQARSVDAVVSDVRMPGHMDGVELAVWISEHTPSVAVVIVSGRRCPDRLKRLLPRTPFLQKPFQMQALLTELNRRVHLH